MHARSRFDFDVVKLGDLLLQPSRLGEQKHVVDKGVGLESLTTQLEIGREVRLVCAVREGHAGDVSGSVGPGIQLVDSQSWMKYAGRTCGWHEARKETH